MLTPLSPTKATQAWLQKIVIDLNLCPFAAKVYQEKMILYNALPYTDIESLIIAFEEAKRIMLDPKAPQTTALLIISAGLDAFPDYLETYYTLEAYLQDNGLDEDIQLASFHPQYQFTGTDIEAPENYTNRSPYPIIHLLRVEDVSKAIESHPYIDAVPKNNIALMGRMGVEQLKVLMQVVD